MYLKKLEIKKFISLPLPTFAGVDKLNLKKVKLVYN
jgi:hypothetical protein